MLTAWALLPVDAQASPRPRLEPRVAQLFAHRDQRGETLPLYQRSAEFERTGIAPLLLRFSRALTEAERASLSASGVELGSAILSGAVRARAPAGALTTLSAFVQSGLLTRVSVALPPALVARPLDAARTELALRAGLAARRLVDGSALNGRGVVIGDLDGSVDVLHPALFHAGPPIAWVDVDGDGLLRPDIDGVDVDGDGSISPGETFRLLDGRARSLFASEGTIAGTDSASFDPGWDYLFLDRDGDGRRSAGRDVEGADALGALGEPVYVADDVDGDGVLSPRERVLPLGSSKVRAVRRAGEVFSRGVNLAAYDFTLDGAAALAHGTSIAGALAGGQPGVSRFLGYAPASDLVIATFGADAEPLTDKLAWLHEQAPDILLTEIGFWGTEPSDGSTELELMLDAMAAQGVLVVSPTGNLASSKKHQRVTLSSEALVSIPLHRDSNAPSQLAVSITWRDGDVTLEGALELGNGEAIELGAAPSSGKLTSGRAYVVSSSVTPKGSGFAIVSVAGKAPVIPESGARLMLRFMPGAAASDAALFVVDDVGGWSAGVQLEGGHAAGSMVSPSHAAGVLTVGAYALHDGPDFSFASSAVHGALRAFSGQGPSLLEGRGVDLVAPDNPIVAASDGAGAALFCPYTEAGGTSAAATAVAGLAALLKQEDPSRQGPELRSALLSRAERDAQVLAGPPDAWGAGKVRLGAPFAKGASPRVRLDGPLRAAPGDEVLVSPIVEDDQPGTRVRWDLGYDGVWDTPFEDPSPRALLMPDASELALKIEALDTDGWAAVASLRIERSLPTMSASRPLEPSAARGGCGCGVAGQEPLSTAAGAALTLFIALVSERVNRAGRARRCRRSRAQLVATRIARRAGCQPDAARCAATARSPRA